MRAGWLTSNPVSTKEDITCSLSDDSGSTVKIQISIFCVDTHPLSHCNPCRAHIKKCSDTPFLLFMIPMALLRILKKKRFSFHCNLWKAMVLIIHELYFAMSIVFASTYKYKPPIHLFSIQRCKLHVLKITIPNASFRTHPDLYYNENVIGRKDCV